MTSKIVYDAARVNSSILRARHWAVRRAEEGYWIAHPDYPLTDWQSEVANDDTRQSYYMWVCARIQEESEL